MHSGLLPSSLCRLPVTHGAPWRRERFWLLYRGLDHRILASARPLVRHGQPEEGRGAMALSLDAAAEVFREAMRDTVKRYSLWYLIQGVLLIAAGILAIIYPVLSSAAVIALLGWLLIISGVVRPEPDRGTPRAAFLRDPGRADRVSVSARSGARANDDRAAPDRVLH